MKRCICLLLLSFTFGLGGPGGASAVPFASLELAAFEDGQQVRHADDRKEGKRLVEPGKKKGRGGSLREGVGARFWGGPYWGYGPRWGHRCETCKADCDENSGGSSCKKCRIRCGW